MNFNKINISAGTDIDSAINNAINLARARGPVEFVFNGVTVQVAADSDPSLIQRDWQRGMLRPSDTFTVHPHPSVQLSDAEILEDGRLIKERDDRAVQRKKEYNAQIAAKKAELSARIQNDIELSNPEAWAKFKENNQDPYGAACVRFAENWARLMQTQIAEGKSLEEIADQASHDADTEGITGFMYGCAVSVLAQTWKHGEQLRRWHNLETQIGTEGEQANETGGVLNPALLNIG